MNIWDASIRDTGKLTVFDGTVGNWQHAVTLAFSLFNTMAKHHHIALHLDTEKDEGTANIVVKVAGGSETYPFEGETVQLTVPQGVVHGKTHTFRREGEDIKKAVIFVPASTQKSAGWINGKEQFQDLSNEGRAALIVHEFIHAAGLDDNKDHDTVGGIFYPTLGIENGKVKELNGGYKTPPMPPIRLEGGTATNLKSQWPKK
jgi:hypothetical protein